MQMPPTTVLRARVMAAVEEALDRAEEAWKDAPGATETVVRVRDSRAAGATVAGAERVRSSKAGEAALAAVSAGIPLVASVLRNRAKTKAAQRAAQLAPLAMRAHPVLLGASLVGGVVLGVAAVRRMQAQSTADASGEHYELSEPAAAELDDDVSRMKGEGGDLGAHDGSTPPRRFVRTEGDQPLTR